MIYIFTQGGIVAVEGGAAAMQALQNIGRQLADDIALIGSQADDANSLLNVVTNSLQGNGLEATKVIGAAAFGGAAAAGLAVGGIPVAGATAIVIGFGWAAGKLYEFAFDSAVGVGQRAGQAAFEIFNPDPLVNTNFTSARSWQAPRDPLVLDLDGDGIEATAIDPNAPILFDHDADNILTATGWIRADDGIVVLDRNGNGLIDSGRELFGDNTLLANATEGQTAANGYHALAQEDSNADSVINSADAIYTQLRIWQDANQDGVSQATELRTLAEVGIASISTVGQATTINLGNGNTQPFSSSFTRTNGTAGTSGTAELSGSLLLAANNFYREFTDDPVVTEAARAATPILEVICRF